MSDKGCAASLVRSDAWLEDLFSEPIYIGIHKNSAGRITFVVNDGTDKVDETGRHYSSIRTSCSIKGMSFADKIITCANRLREPSNAEHEARRQRKQEGGQQ